MRKRILIGVGVVLLVLIGVVAAFVLERRHEGRNIRGSSSVEFVTTEPVKAPTRAELRTVPWPQYGWDEARTRFPVGLAHRPPYRTIWRFRGGSLLEFPPVVAYRRLFFANNSGVMWAISAETGLRAWKHATGRCVAASPAIAGRLVIQTFLNKHPCNASGSGLDGEIVAYGVGGGNVVWQRRIGPSESSPLVADGLVYFGDWNGKVWALDAQTGAVRWTHQVDGKVKGGLAIDGNTVYVGSYDHHVYAFDARNGALRWRTGAQLGLGSQGTFYSTPAAAYGRVYIGATDGKVYSFGATSGALRWSHGTGGYVYGSPAVWRELVYVGSYNGTFYCFDAATGAVKWSFRANGSISGSATVMDGIVYFSTLHETTYGLNALTGRQVWSFPDGKYSPIVADPKRVYLVGYGSIYGMVDR
ncbi:MAG TPA: PQQ-binding-like beta-propeller repeat protein [Gaiellaceae bacterium]|nr:PQQ-binding-like beta-propeller repeat protein [Gaiellaceae bacterium]